MIGTLRKVRVGKNLKKLVNPVIGLRTKTSIIRAAKIPRRNRATKIMIKNLHRKKLKITLFEG